MLLHRAGHPNGLIFTVHFGNGDLLRYLAGSLWDGLLLLIHSSFDA